MGGHGGLNILPQKKWNVYRADRQYEVKYDEHRDIEKRLATREQRKRERLTDSLVELRRKSQGVLNYESRPSEQSEPHRKRRDRSRKHRSVNEEHHHRRSSRSRSPERTAEDDAINIPVSGHINLFEDAEREAQELAEKRRENLIKSGGYVYNSGDKGPRSVNVYTDDASITLVPDFKRYSTPWYMKSRAQDRVIDTPLDSKGGPRFLKSVSTFDNDSATIEEDELKRSFGERLARFSSRHQRSGE
ncbi:hypothetical protein BBOV_I004310 [Babesia bovis T2Bo]|uniref:CBF1-interacting co-repressor CIR N-terminal domain-containing protein n=1 Tax=Babesia bovis TaxID=5865 RepID=A7AWT4_BABBO|nr:hypothetical protein BBOV_I004310 [Babesia bovis T2Bo]EDO05512.1 hypothetical protein BBOV_I004310 [Babesia bovis T2Bo]|eukprot:XP_001609080.1 hypothetical protein [Babesia bovis T2Bo]